jgi:hypothetical protein
MGYTKHDYQTIDEHVAKEIKRLHESYPKLGHHGLAEALRGDGFDVEPAELKRFIREEGLRPARDWRPWRWRGLPSWMIGGPPETPK